jgi:hypothetical protein
VPAVIGANDIDVIKVVESAESGICDENDVTAAPAVPSRRAAKGHEFFSTKGNTAIAAVTGYDLDFTFVHETHWGRDL